jgi:tRNA A37 threonylcarbamoyladenosine modification protein TsaB
MALAEPCLVIDASARAGLRVGIVQGGRWISQVESTEGALEATSGCVGEVLKSTGLQLADVQSFALNIGPGSMLGIRVAALTVRAWSALKPRPIYVWESLVALATVALERGQKVPFVVVVESRLKRWNVLEVNAQKGFSTVAECEVEQVKQKTLPILVLSDEANKVFPGATKRADPWADLPKYFSEGKLLKLESKPEPLNATEDFALWSGERHRGNL